MAADMGLGQTAPMKARVEGGEAIEVLLCNRGRISLQTPGRGRSDRVTEIVDEELAVAGVALSTPRNVIKRLVGSAQPEMLVLPDRADSVEFSRHQPVAGQCLSIP